MRTPTLSFSLSLPGMPFSRKRVEQMAKTGGKQARRQAEAWREAIPEDRLADLFTEWRDQAEPLVDRALRRKKRRTGLRIVVGLLFALTTAVLVYIVLQRRDKEGAYLVQEPDEPHVAPAGSDTGPAAGMPSDPDGGREAPATATPPQREPIGVRASVSAVPSSAVPSSGVPSSASPSNTSASDPQVRGSVPQPPSHGGLPFAAVREVPIDRGWTDPR